MIEIMHPEYIFCSECLYKTCQTEEHPCRMCVTELNGTSCTEWKPAGTPEEVK